MIGHAPRVIIGPANPERAKYERMWEREEYRNVAPGENWALTFMQQARMSPHAEVIDFGCGTGRGGLMLALLAKAKVTLVDFSPNCLDEDVASACETQGDRIKFVEGDLTRPLDVKAEYGYCTDVMEHIPPEDVDKVLANVLGSAQKVFFAIATEEDKLGALIGEKLHLTVQPAEWWADKLRECGAVIHWQHVAEGACAFYCSAWHEAREVLNGGVINVPVETLDAQVRQNILDGWAHITPYVKQDREVVLLAGGPSMNDHVETIQRLRESGCGLVTVNGSYHWALNHGLKPSVQIVLDAREFNKRFVEPVTEYTKYLIASQAHPATLEGLPKDRTWLWHAGISEENQKLALEKAGNYFPVAGGCTVILRAIPLLRMIGFSKLHIFGFDSCVGAEHHAYAQAENDNEPTVPVTCNGRIFMCAPWMVAQASEFRDVVQFMGDEVELEVYGDGLIAAMIQAGYEFSQE